MANAIDRKKVSDKFRELIGTDVHGYKTEYGFLFKGKGINCINLSLEIDTTVGSATIWNCDTLVCESGAIR